MDDRFVTRAALRADLERLGLRPRRRRHDADAPFAAPSGGTSVGQHVYVGDVDRFSDRAARAGTEILQEPTDMFYGDRTVMLRDPFGHVWVFLTHVEDLTTPEIERRGTELIASSTTT